jgi:hypothetical protein
MKKIIKVQLSPMCELVQSIMTLYYEEENYYSFMEEKGTIEDLCTKYQIIKNENETYDSRHLVGKKCRLTVKDGKTIFLGYC